MCGIFGIVAPKVDRGFLETATTTLVHRSPDNAGYHLDDHAGLGHRRLSIIDLSGSDQPIFNEDRSKCIVFNGEIYNFSELRNRIIVFGHAFVTNVDTNTILHACEKSGESMPRVNT